MIYFVNAMRKYIVVKTLTCTIYTENTHVELTRQEEETCHKHAGYDLWFDGIICF